MTFPSVASHIEQNALVIAFDGSAANATCQRLQPLTCMQWPAVLLRNRQDRRLSAALRAGLIRQSTAIGSGSLGNVGYALAHISSWQHIADARMRLASPRLIMEEDEVVKESGRILPLLRTMANTASRHCCGHCCGHHIVGRSGVSNTCDQFTVCLCTSIAVCSAR